MLFSKDKLGDFSCVLQTFLDLLNSHIAADKEWGEQGSYIAVSAITALFDYGSPNSILRQLVEHGNRRQTDMLGCVSASTSPDSKHRLEDLEAPSSLSLAQFRCAVDMFSRITKLVFRSGGIAVNWDILPFANLGFNFLLLTSRSSFPEFALR